MSGIFSKLFKQENNEIGLNVNSAEKLEKLSESLKDFVVYSHKIEDEHIDKINEYLYDLYGITLPRDIPPKEDTINRIKRLHEKIKEKGDVLDRGTAQRIYDLESTLDDIKEEYEEPKRQLQNDLNELRASSEESKKIIESKEARIRELENQLEKVDVRVLNRNIKDLTEEKAEFKELYEKEKGYSSVLKQSLEYVKNEKESLEESKNDEIIALKKEIKNLHFSNDNLTDTKDKALSKMETMEKTLKEKEEENETLKKENGKLTNQVKSKDFDIEDKNNEIKKLRDTLDREKRENINSVKDVKDELERYKKKMESNFIDKDSIQNEYIQKNRDLQNQIADLEKENNQLFDDNQRLSIDNQNQINSIKRLQLNISELEQSNSEYEKTIKDLKNEISNVQKLSEESKNNLESENKKEKFEKEELTGELRDIVSTLVFEFLSQNMKQQQTLKELDKMCEMQKENIKTIKKETKEVRDYQAKLQGGVGQYNQSGLKDEKEVVNS